MNRGCCCLSSLSVFNNYTWTHTDRQTITMAHTVHGDSTNKKEEAPQLRVEACCHFAFYQDYSPIATHSQHPNDHLPLSKRVQHNSFNIDPDTVYNRKSWQIATQKETSRLELLSQCSKLGVGGSNWALGTSICNFTFYISDQRSTVKLIITIGPKYNSGIVDLNKILSPNNNLRFLIFNHIIILNGHGWKERTIALDKGCMHCKAIVQTSYSILLYII